MTARVELYREMVPDGDTEPVLHMPTGPWRWRYVSSNGRIMADGGQGYTRRIDCLKGCAAVLGGSVATVDSLGKMLIVVRAEGSGIIRTVEIRDLTRS